MSVWIVVGWLVVSLVVGIIVGKWLAWGTNDRYR